ncbi:hypothetical protein CS0771_46620 [Catellatospora sp. IY07-71]|nr:hypothetical protein CS0771_46620 [Catellatospora sp. IY07-71]
MWRPIHRSRPPVTASQLPAHNSEATNQDSWGEALPSSSTPNSIDAYAATAQLTPSIHDADLRDNIGAA